MKNLLVVIRTMLVILIVTSCNGPDKSSDNQAVNPGIDQSAEKSDATASPDQSKSEDDKKTVGNQLPESMTGSQLIENTTNTITTKLGLNEQQSTSLKNILLKAFQSSGEDLNKTYSSEQFKAIHQSIIEKSFEPIMAILDDTQKDKFNKKFGPH